MTRHTPPQASRTHPTAAVRFALGACLVVCLAAPAAADETAMQDPYAESVRLNADGLDAYRAGDYTKARDAFARALALREETLGGDHPEVAVSLNNLGQVYADLWATTPGPGP